MTEKFEKAYPFLKAAVSAAALCFCLFHTGDPLPIAAIIFCVAGDLFLAFSGELHRQKKEPAFTLGIGSFAVAHIFLFLYFVALNGFHLWMILAAGILSILLPIGIYIGFIVPGKYNARIIAYGIIVSLMLANSIGHPAMTGAILFWISDALLSIWYFHPGAPFWIGGVALVVYYCSLFKVVMAI